LFRLVPRRSTARGRARLSNDCSFPRDQVSAQVTAAAHKLALVNGWQSAQFGYNTGDPAYPVSNGVVHLSGSLLQPTGSNQIFAVLPKADRPKHDLYIRAMVYTPGNTAHTGTVLI
jgi:hypothetical protein